MIALRFAYHGDGNADLAGFRLHAGYIESDAVDREAQVVKRMSEWIMAGSAIQL
jgi:hypothetical protein